MRRVAGLCVTGASLWLLAAPLAWAGDEPPALGRYLPRYPAIYYSLGYAQDDRDRSFDQNGVDQPSALPTLPGATAFPETRLSLSFSSYFPLLEDAGIPYLSGRLHVAQLHLRHGKTQAEGAIEPFIASNPEFSPRSKGGDSGIGDIGVSWGSFLYGGQDWRTRKDNPLAVLLRFSVEAPVGSYEQTAPVTIGSNRFAFGATLGLHARPWQGAILEGGMSRWKYARNRNAHFGRLSPAQQGSDRLFDLSLTQKIFSGFFAGLYLSDRKGGTNEYRDPRYAANAPEPDPAPPGGTTESFPISGTYYDQGTALRTAGLSLNYFITQRWNATLDLSNPLSGRSGQLTVPFRQRQCPAGSLPGASTCDESDMGPVLLDGLGSARSYSSNSLRLSFSYNFGHADLYPCQGCAP